MQMTISEYIIKYRRLIHANPEVGFNTFKTAELVKSVLDELGYKTRYILNNAGVIASLNNKKMKTIGFRADMDALEITEKTNLDFKATNHKMHACGHDAHTAILLGAAKLLIEERDSLSCNVILIFQCAEEGPLPGGAATIIESNELPKLDEIYALHVSNNYECGEIAVNFGVAFSSADFFDIAIIGKSGHGAHPEKANNPNIPAAELTLAIDKYISMRRQQEKCAYTVTTIHSGNSYNIIPVEANISGTIRTLSTKTQAEIHNYTLELCEKTAKKYNVKIKFNHHYGYPPLINNDKMTDKVIVCAKKVSSIKKISVLEEPTMVAEDFSYYLQKIPGCMFWLGVKEESVAFSDLHADNFTLNENALINGALIFLNIAKEK